MRNALSHIWRHPLNAKAPISGLVRFARWQIATRLLPETSIAVPFTDRARLLVSRSMYGATQNVYCGLNDFEDMSFLVHYLRDADVFIDVGANVGAYTILASAAAKAYSYAFEPSPGPRNSLFANVEINRITDRVTIEPYAVGREAGSVSMVTGGPNAMHHVGRHDDASTLLVTMRTIDAYHLAPAIMKIDVEGYEAEVLAGAAETIKRPELVAIVTENSDDSRNFGEGIESVADFMRRNDFQPMTYDPWRRELREKNKKSDNTLYIRDVAKARQRVAEAEPFLVFGRSI